MLCHFNCPVQSFTSVSESTAELPPHRFLQYHLDGHSLLRLQINGGICYPKLPSPQLFAPGIVLLKIAIVPKLYIGGQRLGRLFQIGHMGSGA